MTAKTAKADLARLGVKSKPMKLHRFFAFAAVACFLLTMYTGYNHN